jgi:hypothetical protein
MSPIKSRYLYKTGKFQSEYDHLRKLIPKTGKIPGSEKRPHLERLRKAANIYYDLHNYNLVNYHNMCYGVLKLSYKAYLNPPVNDNDFCRFSEEFLDLVEQKLDIIIQNAFMEDEYLSKIIPL